MDLMVLNDHNTECYFSMELPIQNGMSMKVKQILVFPNIPSAIRSMPSGDRLPDPETPNNFALYSDDEDGFSSNNGEQQPSASRDADYLPSTDSSSHKMTEDERSVLIRDLEIPKK